MRKIWKIRQNPHLTGSIAGNLGDTKETAEDHPVNGKDVYKRQIFRLNYLNILSNRAQVAYEKLWNSHIGNTEEKILNFLVLRSIDVYKRQEVLLCTY